MPGRQLNFSIRGDQYEQAFDAIASRFLIRGEDASAR